MQPETNDHDVLIRIDQRLDDLIAENESDHKDIKASLVCLDELKRTAASNRTRLNVTWGIGSALILSLLAIVIDLLKKAYYG